jgi:nicotinate-nucleotide--dimethylbenzimidazole phosphoribosyltransferase
MNAPLRLSTILPTADPSLERALLDKLALLAEQTGTLGELEPLAVRLGLMQASLEPRFVDPQVLIVAGDHGLAVDGIQGPLRMDTLRMVELLLDGRMPVNTLADLHSMRLSVVDAGIAAQVPPSPRLVALKTAFGTRNARMGAAMSMEQAQEAICSGMTLGASLPGNALLCAGVGVGSRESAALVLSRLTDTPVRDLFAFGPHYSSARIARLMGVAQGALGRHPDAHDPVEVLAAFGGFEMAVLVGLQLAAAERRHLVMVDGLCALGALMVASRLAPAVTDYCVFSRSHTHPCLDNALALFKASAILEMGMDSLDGSGAVLAWPLVNSAAALLGRQALYGRDDGAVLNKR